MILPLLPVTGGAGDSGGAAFKIIAVAFDAVESGIVEPVSVANAILAYRMVGGGAAAIIAAGSKRE